MKIIGHRGAAGLALENTLQAIRAGIDAGSDALEFDVRATKDGQYVVFHDATLGRVSGSKQKISDLTYQELQNIPLHNGESVPLLRDVLKAAGRTPVIVEIKVRGHAESICRVLDEFPDATIWVASFYHDVARECRRLRPHLPVLLASHYDPIGAIRRAKSMSAFGLDLNYMTLSPLVYWLANRAGLTIMTYTVNNRHAVELIRRLYPKVWICTNYPDRFVKLEKHERRF